VISCANDFKEIEHSLVFYKRVSEQYEDNKILKSIKTLIPENVADINQDCNNDKLLLLSSLLNWFKNDFMNWTPKQIKCPNCNGNSIHNNNCSAGDNTPISHFMQSKVHANNSSWKYRKTEIHTCIGCGIVYTFPRYGEILKIATTRRGRCSEWSILFGAILNSMSVKARIVHDYLDHCWNEALIDGQWIHVDSTLQYPLSLSHPHYYEQNWKKQYLYVLAFDAREIEDVTQKYTEQWDNILLRRSYIINDCIYKQKQKIESMSPIVRFQNLYSMI
jgi:peptide-N4-(N-acetyl-beta-glucosaminyl)asparagine amidase